MTVRRTPVAARQRGGFVLGLVVGLLIGLALALGVAMYVTKMPVPFLDKVPHRTPEQDAAEQEHNRNWDPNAPLGSRSPLPAAPSAAASQTPAAASAAMAAASRAAASRAARDPAAILSGASPGADAASAAPAPEPLMYFVQTGAFTRSEEAEQQRAALALEGFSARVSEREQNGRTLFRVRIGPFDVRADADSTLERVRSTAPPATIIRIERPPRAGN